MSPRSSQRRGFTLLEVLVAVAILGLGLTVILSAQTGMFASVAHAERLTVAVNHARCKMNEVELDLLEKGYQLGDQTDSGRCCEDDDSDFRCEWKVETIVLPSADSADSGGLFGGDEGGGADSAGGLGTLGALSQLAQAGPSGVQAGAGIGGLSDVMGAAMEGTSGIAPMVMGLVYPSLKPLLEASIRKITIEVQWKAGKTPRTLKVTQYVTNPTQGGLDPNAALGVDAAAEQMESQPAPPLIPTPGARP